MELNIIYRDTKELITMIKELNNTNIKINLCASNYNCKENQEDITNKLAKIVGKESQKFNSKNKNGVKIVEPNFNRKDYYTPTEIRHNYRYWSLATIYNFIKEMEKDNNLCKYIKRIQMPKSNRYYIQKQGWYEFLQRRCEHIEK